MCFPYWQASGYTVNSDYSVVDCIVLSVTERRHRRVFDTFVADEKHADPGRKYPPNVAAIQIAANVDLCTIIRTFVAKIIPKMTQKTVNTT
jgi:hypothetical protein